MSLKIATQAPLTTALAKEYSEHPLELVTTAEIWDHATRMEMDRADLLGALKGTVFLFETRATTQADQEQLVFARHLISRMEPDRRARAKDNDW